MTVTTPSLSPQIRTQIRPGLRATLSKIALLSTSSLFALILSLTPATGLLAAEPDNTSEALANTAAANATASSNAAEVTADDPAEMPKEAASTKPQKVRLETTKGSIVIEVYPEKAPMSAANFLKLVDDGFYDGLVFHRVIANFMVQVGGYDAKLTYRAPPETVPNESSNGLENKRGTLAMARQTDPDSADAQFFINMRDNPHLDPVSDRPGYTVFGKVLAGMEVAERIELSDTNIQNGMAGVPVHPIEIISAARLP